MSTNNERDTKFLGFAQLLISDLQTINQKHLSGVIYDPAIIYQEQQTLIAQRAYDLLYYALEHDPHCYSPSDAILSIPDMTEFP